MARHKAFFDLVEPDGSLSLISSDEYPNLHKIIAIADKRTRHIMRDLVMRGTIQDGLAKAYMQGMSDAGRLIYKNST